MPNIVGTPPHCGASGPVGPHVLSKDAPTEAPIDEAGDAMRRAFVRMQPGHQHLGPR